MKTVLIVEDEKMIRQGIKTMIMRSGVPVDVIIECNNGEMALEVIKEQEIDVMFTDIRMPKMDGIELVQKMQECEHIPVTVAISGYDDFSYAVEMMRNGVREYILKPIEREKITAVLTKLNQEIEEQKEKERKSQQIGYQQLKHYIQAESMPEEEIQTIEEQYAAYFDMGDYSVCCRNEKARRNATGENYIYLPKMEVSEIFIVPQEKLNILLKNELADSYTGISAMHHGFRELKTAYQEAVQERRVAFARNRQESRYGEETEHIPEGLLREAEKLTESAARMQRVQLLGTDRTEELDKSFRQLFGEVKNGRISEEQLEECVLDFLEQIENTYRNAVEEEEQGLKQCREILQEDCIDSYQEKLMGFVMQLHEKLNNQFDLNKNTKKMKQAVEYIEARFASDLNMAVVSNYVSMNYSLFSYSFKQYTGSNFVNYLKDIRMKEAQKMLADTDLKIIEISQAVGYDNEKHFMKIFKATFGVSPSEYRKNMNRE